MTPPVRISVVIAVLALAVSGCGGSDHPSAKDKPVASSTSSATPTDTPSARDEPATSSSSAAPAVGDIQETKYFSYRAPKGWKGPASPVVSGPVSVVGDTDDHDGFTDNINVIRIDPPPAATADALEKAAVLELKGGHATDIKVLPQQKIDGTPAVHITSGFSQNGVKYLINQFTMLHGNVAYVVTFSYSNTVTPKRENSVAQSVMATWKWAS